jgi:DNA invertase Pin-like site-specific DNA recombinase
VGLKQRKRVLELIRVSTSAQAAEDRAGIPAQKAANLKTAAQHNLEIVHSIQISDVSGAAVLRSPEMQELLGLIESSNIHGVVAKEFSRLMRPENFSDYALLQAFADTGTILYLPDGAIDFRSKSGRLYGALRAAMAGLERTEILDRIWCAKEERRRIGKHPQSQIALPFAVGYEPKSGRWFFKPEVEKVREAFRCVLSGETSYTEIGRTLGLEPFNLRNILRNPIYSGWRVYDKRRDPSPKALRVRADGRQGDRPKIDRDASDIIRVKVLEPLISEHEFFRVQQILDLKKANHWRSRPDHERRFTYSGFLRCALCGNLIYTHSHKPRDWYVCKSRTYPERQIRAKKALPECNNPYMRRETIEKHLDEIFGKRLCEPAFLERITSELIERHGSKINEAEKSKLERMRKQLQEKRERVLDAYFENLTSRIERDRRLAQIIVDERFCDQKLDSLPNETHSISVQELAQILAPLQEWMFLSRTDKRRLLQTIVPEIHIQNYQVTQLAVVSVKPHRDEINRTDMDSSPPPA